MSSLVQARSRLISVILRSDRRPYSTVTEGTPKETVLSSSIISDQPPPPPSNPPTPAPIHEAGKRSWSFLKYGLVAALTGGTAAAGYATFKRASKEDARPEAAARPFLETFVVGLLSWDPS